ncbi:unnamed protein product [Callosobruchus maculatus]|uniref:Uncharacterized protein n=1 Tax=Callosobruchus maculatus TaxID=64391 RepID=A0A653CJJ9_CALMS|nr:unnamed protein product [Callosobruchus maculatus]
MQMQEKDAPDVATIDAKHVPIVVATIWRSNSSISGSKSSPKESVTTSIQTNIQVAAVVVLVDPRRNHPSVAHVDEFQSPSSSYIRRHPHLEVASLAIAIVNREILTRSQDLVKHLGVKLAVKKGKRHCQAVYYLDVYFANSLPLFKVSNNPVALVVAGRTASVTSILKFVAAPGNPIVRKQTTQTAIQGATKGKDD